MTRVAARYVPPAPVPVRRAMNAAEGAGVVLRAIEIRGELYSVDVADLLGWRVQRTKSLLADLEHRGLLVSRKEASPRSGLGRRYYRLAGTPCSCGVRHKADARCFARDASSRNVTACHEV